MAGPTTNRTVNIYINDSAAQTKLTALKANQDRLTDAIRKGEAAGKDMTDSIARLGNTQSKIKQLEDILSGKLAPTLQMVKARAMELRGELNRMSASESGFAEKLREYQAVNAQWQQMQTSIGNVGGAMGRAQAASNSFWKDAGKIALGTVVGNTVQAGLQAITGYIAGLVSGNAKLSDSLADVRKATGLTEGGVAKLNTELGKIDTRTASSQLRDIAIGLGQIGEAATKETVAAVDKIVVALGDEFGGGAKEVTTTLGVLRNNLQDVKSNNYGADILAIGNALNTLGAEGLATAPVVVDFANRMAGVAGTFKLTSGQILGLSATMQELGINVERGSTATIKIFQKIASAPEAFAKVAGMEVKKFTDLINRDMLGAFNAVAIGAGKASGKNTEFARILKELDADGSGAGEVLSKLSSNQELLANKTALASRALKESSSITDEFNTKNNNLAANLEKLSKNISKWFANSTLTNLLNGIVSSIVNLRKETQSATEQFDKQVGSVVNLQTNIAPLLQRYDDLAKKSNKSAEENAEMKSIIEQVTAVMPSAVTAFDQYGNSIAISTARVRKFIDDQKDNLKYLNQKKLEELNEELRIEKTKLKQLQDINDQIANTGTYTITKVGGGKEPQIDVRKATEVEIENARELYKKQISLINGINQEIAKNNGDAIENQIKAQEEARAEAAKKAKDLLNNNTTSIDFSESNANKLKELEAQRAAFMRKIIGMDSEMEAATISNDEREVQRAKNKYAELFVEAKKLFDGHIKLAEAQTILSETQQQELNNLYAKHFKARSEAEYAATVEKTTAHFNKEKELANIAFANGKITQEQHSEALLNITEQEFSAKALVAADYAQNSERAAADLTEAERRESEKRVQIAAKEWANKRNERLASAELRVARSPLGSNQELQAKKELLRTQFELEMEGKEKTNSMYLLKEEELSRSLANADNQFIANKISIYAQLAGELGNIGQAFTQGAIDKLQREVEANRNASEAEKADWQRKLDKKKISKARYDKEIDRLNKEQAAKELELKVKQFNADKQAKLIQGGVNLAMAISNIIAQWAGNPIAVGILGAAAAAANAIQLGFIAAAQPPKFGDGGILPGKGGVTKGASHQSGGIALIDQNGKKVGEVEGDEPILSKETYVNNREIVNALLESSMRLGGKRINMPWLYQQSKPINIQKAVTAMQYNSSRSSNPSPEYRQNNTGGQQPNGLLDDRSLEVMERWIAQMEKGVKASVYYNEWDKTNNEINDLKKMGSSKPNAF